MDEEYNEVLIVSKALQLLKWSNKFLMFNMYMTPSDLQAHVNNACTNANSRT